MSFFFFSYRKQSSSEALSPNGTANGNGRLMDGIVWSGMGRDGRNAHGKKRGQNGTGRKERLWEEMGTEWDGTELENRPDHISTESDNAQLKVQLGDFDLCKIIRSTESSQSQRLPTTTADKCGGIIGPDCQFPVSNIR